MDSSAPLSIARDAESLALPRPAEGRERRLLAVASLLQLERRARRAATESELGFIAVNDTFGFVEYRQAVLWRRDGRGRGRIVALSGAALPDRNAPFLVWGERLARWIDRHRGPAEPTTVDAAGLPPDLARDWAEWLPAHAVWIPLDGGREARPGGLLLARDAPWTEHDLNLLGYLGEAYGHAWTALRTSGRVWRRVGRGRPGRAVLLLVASGLAAAGLMLPVRQSALAPAEVVASAPTVVRAPVDGVVDRVEVRPNQPVREGQVLLVLDRARLEARLQVARKAFEIAEAEYRQAAQQALVDARTKANLAVLTARMDQQAAEIAYVQELLDRVEIKAPRGGIVLFDDANDWIGKPVTLGERIMTVADPRETELEIRLPVADAIDLPPEAEIRLFLNVAPAAPLPARLTYAGYLAEPTPEGVPAYRIRAAFEGGEPPRIGLKGTAKLYGHDTSLFLYLLRRPWTAIRQQLGL